MRMSQSCMHLVEYADAWRFEERVSEWMRRRGIESTDVLELLLAMVTAAHEPVGHTIRMFAVMDGERIAAAATLSADGHLAITRATDAATHALADGLQRAGCLLSDVYGPADAAREFARLWAARTSQHYELDPGEDGIQHPAVGHKITFWPPLRTGLI